MGRGRAKAKQTKVARELKYRHLDTDFSQLQRELHGDESASEATPAADVDDDEDDEVDGAARFADPRPRYDSEDAAS
jgi:hypothetical protein